jgi:hypothetical protein
MECWEMEVSNLGVNLQLLYQVIDGPLPIKEGEVNQIFIKERFPNNEAKVVLKGQEALVKFDGPIPPQDQVYVQISQLNENGKMVVKPVATSTVLAQMKTADTLLNQSEFDPYTHPELREAVKQILSKGGNISKDALIQLQEFLKNEPGSLTEKLEVIKIIQQKNIGFTKVQLNAVNIALHGNSLTDSLIKLVDFKNEVQTIGDQKGYIDTPREDKAHFEVKNANLSEIRELNTPNKKSEMPSELNFKNQAVQKPDGVSGLNAFSDLENLDRSSQSSITEPIQSPPKIVQGLNNEVMQNFVSKDIVVTEVTKKQSQLAIDFKKMQSDVIRNLDTASKLIDAKSLPPVKQVLEAAINTLDKAILKGDFMLYTDMETEKQLLSASSRLAEAKNLLTKGNIVEANQIVKDIKSVLDQVNFKPSNNRVQHFPIEQEIQPIFEKVTEPSARQIFEMVKGLGLTHEVDVAHALADNQEIPNNLKSALLKMFAADGQSKEVQSALSNITGQQLLNKQDSNGVQNLLLQLPIVLNKQVENVKIFINSQKQSEKIDWENCSLYFVLETKKLGDVGIQISAVNRNLSITFKNKSENLQEIVKPLVEEAMARLVEIGYNIGGIQFKPFTKETVAKVEKQPKVKVKGFDFSV